LKRHYSGYQSYLDYKSILENLITGKSIKELEKITGIPLSTLYKTILNLEKFGVIKCERFDLVHGIKVRVFCVNSDSQVKVKTK